MAKTESHDFESLPTPERVGAEPDAGPPRTPGTEPAPSTESQVRRLIELIRPVVQSDGGDLELVRVTSDGVVQVRFHGACVGCPSSTMTLQVGIERSLCERVPGIRRVEAVD